MAGSKDEHKEEEKDALESFVDQNMDAFNQHEPSPELLERIKPSFNGKDQKQDEKETSDSKSGRKIIPFSSWIKIAAILLVSFSLIYLIYENQTLKSSIALDQNNSTTKEDLDEAETRENFPLSSVSSELAEVEQFYVSEVDLKLKSAKALNVDEEVLKEVDLLNEEFSELKKDMKQSINDEQIIEAMIDNYRLKIELLDHILSEYQTKNSSSEKEQDIKKEENEKETTYI